MIGTEPRANRRERTRETWHRDEIEVCERKEKKSKTRLQEKENQMGGLMKSGEKLKASWIVRVAGRNERPNDKLSNSFFQIFKKEKT